MFDFDAVWRQLGEAGLGHWRAAIEGLIRGRHSDTAHGDFRRWQSAL
jgi:hypothetical protein